MVRSSRPWQMFSREARGACLMSCWGRGPATGSPPLSRGKGAALFFFYEIGGSFSFGFR